MVVPMVLVALLVVAVDQWSKFYIQSHMFPGMSVPVIPNIFHITFILNPGAAFGILEYQTAFFVFIALAMVAAVIAFYFKYPKQHAVLRYGTALMIGGAIGNVIDRIKTGYVVDFFDLRIWPVFNVADIAIVTGVGCIILSLSYFSSEKDENA